MPRLFIPRSNNELLVNSLLPMLRLRIGSFNQKRVCLPDFEGDIMELNIGRNLKCLRLAKYTV